MTNLLEQAINCNDGDHAAKINQGALGIESDDVATTASRKLGSRTVSSGRGSSASGCKLRPAIWPTMPNVTPFFEFVLAVVVTGSLVITLWSAKRRV